MAPVLHTLSFSAPCRAVEMLADVMNLNMEKKTVDLLKGEHLHADYLKINPHHTVPTLVDGDFSLWESRAILAYLVNQYAPGSPLYPVDPKKRALVDRALNFDASTLYPMMGSVVYPVIKLNKKLDKELASMLDAKLELFNNDLAKTKYVAGDELTIADLSLLATWTSIEAIGVWDTKNYSNIHEWSKRVTKHIKNADELVVKTSQFYGNWIKEKLNAA